jgi:glycosyltransferase involved in cell wall biosynthesis
MLAACPFPANHGTPGSIREMAEAIVERGHEVHIVTYPMGEDIPIRGPHLHRIASWTGESGIVVGPTVRKPLYDLQLVFKALQVIRQHRLEVIHAHGYEAALAACLCRLDTGLPVVYSAAMTMSNELASYRFIRPRWLASGLAKLLDAVVSRIPDRCIPHSANLERFFCRQGLRARTEPVIHKGIDVDWAAQGDGAAVRRRYGLDGALVVLYAGVLSEFQRLDLLLEAMAEVCREEPRARLLVAQTFGTAGQLAGFRGQVERLGLADRVVLTDPQPLATIRDFIHACDLAVVPRPRAAGFPIKILNYLAAAKPCVLFASSASGLTHGENAYLVAPDTSAALGKAIREVLQDAGTRQRLAANGYQYVRTHRDRRQAARQICAVYARALAEALP